jgi:hypothetical protein|uniref:Uncharacterized protein n=1 Tax=Siphoviridae sp. ctCNm48 TaxID=2825377 RepID=A0A8S5TWC6_9CAUD|nr:MAG TPA: hypothetical protein [Siphoviridae sp. ctCNm48]
MERLTKHSKQTSHENGICCTHFCGPECIGVGGNCAMNCKWEEAAWSRLAAYEDTGLTPEEFHAYWVFLEDMIGEQKASEALDRFRQLVKADRDGRLVVLPCKVGQRVFALLDTDKHISECEVKQIGMGNKIGFIGLEPIGARGREYGISLNGFGKTVFRTREEAENALGAMKDGR